MYFSESKNLILKNDEVLSDVEAQYYKFLGDQQDMIINMAPYITTKQSGLSSSLGLIKMPTDAMDDKITETQSRTALPTHSEHFMPYLMKYILENRMGVLPYQSQLNDKKVM
jgi:hypothetical protein